MNRNQVVEQLPGLRRYARVLTGEAWAADDLVQDTLERACTKWLLWRTGTDLRAWLFTLMHNLYLNQRRSLPTLALLDIDDVQHQLINPSGGCADDALDLERCLQRLPADQRAVLLLVAMEEMSYEDTARILGIPVGTVMSRLSRARTRLRALMETTSAPVAQPAATPGPNPPAPAAAALDLPPKLRRLK